MMRPEPMEARADSWGRRDTETLPGELTGRENIDPGNRSEAVALALQEGEAAARWVVDTRKPTATLQGQSRF